MANREDEDENLQEILDELIDKTGSTTFQLGPHKLTSRQVRFAVELAKGRPHTDAYATAGYSTNYNYYKLRGKALDLAKNHKVADFISRIRERFVEQQVINMDYIVRQMLEIKERAYSENDPKLELDCLKEMAKVSGMYTPESQDNRTQVANYIKFEPGNE